MNPNHVHPVDRVKKVFIRRKMLLRPHVVHQRPEDIDVVLEDVADQHVGDVPFQVGVTLTNRPKLKPS